MADAKISALTAAGSFLLADELAVNEAGASKKVTGTQMQTGLFTAPTFAAGSASASSWPKRTNGTLLTSPEANAIENDGTAWYKTLDTTSGRSQECNQHIFRLAADQSTVGTTIADFFTSTSSFPTVTNGIYEINYYLWYLKSTAGTLIFTVTNTQTYTNLVGRLLQSPAAGMGTSAALFQCGIDVVTAAAAAFPATASLTTAVEHCTHIRVIAECATAGNIRLRVTNSAGTVTARRGCYYTARRLFAGNVGTFVA